ncbi:MAG: hypothetical protein HQM03_00075 [Magnetococcales bacterium]|nr:hypothetical protein [Magnetococcales bacterium]
MNDPIPFMQPRMVGERFQRHAIPLEMLKDLAVLDEMIIEVAKWCYLQDHPGRQRSPRGFTDGISLKLTGIAEGSAVPQVSLFMETPGVLFSANQVYLELARERFCGAINAAANDEKITDYLPENLLGYFDRLGRSLRNGEMIEFDPNNALRPARLDKLIRRKLVLASRIKEYTDEIVLRGTVPEIDQANMTFEVETIGGSKVVARMRLQQLETVLAAIRGYQSGDRLMVQGVGRFDGNGRLKGIDEIEHICILDPLDVTARLEEFRSIRDGWLEGEGYAPSRDGLDWLTDAFGRNYPEGLPLPYLYPSAEGGIQAEWSLGRHEISLEVDLNTKQAEWHDLDMDTKEWNEHTFHLASPEEWIMLADRLRCLTGENRV